MVDREKVIKGLECCILHNPDDHARCMQCPYESNCVNRLKMDALTLLKEQKYGHWILDPNGMDWNIPAWCCSECHCRNDNIPPNMVKVNPLRWSGSKFCPNCGAKMER